MTNPEDQAAGSAERTPESTFREAMVKSFLFSMGELRAIQRAALTDTGSHG